MANSKEYYVTVRRVWRRSRWTTRLGVGEDPIGPWFWNDKPEVLAVFRLEATSRDEALGMTAEFMLRGMPSYMDVETLHVGI